MNETMIELSGVSVGYGDNVIIRDIDLKIKKGTIVSLIGPNGSGKSTLLKTLVGELKAISGQIRINGKLLSEQSSKELSKTIAILMTDRFKSGFMTAGEIAALGRYPFTDLLGRLSKEDEKAVQNAMELLNITELSDKYFNRLSDGQRQLVMLARAICQEPSILIMDEPTSFLDINYKLELMRIVKELSQRGITVVMSLHELELAKGISDSLVCIRDGRIIKNGPPSEIFSEQVIGEIFNIKDFGMLKDHLFNSVGEIPHL